MNESNLIFRKHSCIRGKNPPIVYPVTYGPDVVI